jgi:uncharacterized protein YjiS (DUF1127 family)
MRTSTNVDSLSTLEEGAPRNAVTCRDAAIVVLRHNQGDGPAVRHDLAVSTDEIESWAEHARAANGLGDLETATAAYSNRASGQASYQTARSHRSFTLGEILVAVLQVAISTAHRAYARYQQHRQAGAIYDTLRELDDRTLRDLGFDRSEIRSVAAELTGEAERTRMRVLLSSYGLPK